VFSIFIVQGKIGSCWRLTNKEAHCKNDAMDSETFVAKDFLPCHFRRRAPEAVLGDGQEAAARRSPGKKV
jgi:hypothetical protein